MGTASDKEEARGCGFALLVLDSHFSVSRLFENLNPLHSPPAVISSEISLLRIKRVKPRKKEEKKEVEVALGIAPRSLEGFSESNVWIIMVSCRLLFSSWG